MAWAARRRSSARRSPGGATRWCWPPSAGWSGTRDKGSHFFDQDGKPVHRYLGPESIAYELEQSLRRLRHRPHRPLHHPLAGPDDAGRRDDGRARGPEDRPARSARSAPATSSPADLEAYLAAGELDAIQEQYSMVHRDIEAELAAALRCATASRSSATRRWRSACSPARSARSATFEGDDLRIDDPRFSLENRRKVADFAARDRADRRGAWRHASRETRHRLDAAPAGHHLRALRRAQSGPGEGERARRRDPARRSRTRRDRLRQRRVT